MPRPMKKNLLTFFASLQMLTFARFSLNFAAVKAVMGLMGKHLLIMGYLRGLVG